MYFKVFNELVFSQVNDKSFVSCRYIQFCRVSVTPKVWVTDTSILLGFLPLHWFFGRISYPKYLGNRYPNFFGFLSLHWFFLGISYPKSLGNRYLNVLGLLPLHWFFLGINYPKSLGNRYLNILGLLPLHWFFLGISYPNILGSFTQMLWVILPKTFG